MPKFLKIILILGPIAVVGIVVLIFTFLNSKSTISEVEFDSEYIPTLYSIVGKRKVVGYHIYYSNIESRKSFVYGKNVVSSYDIDKYIEKLESLGYIVSEKISGNVIQLAKESKDIDKVILVEIYYYDNINILFRKVKGSLD